MGGETGNVVSRVDMNHLGRKILAGVRATGNEGEATAESVMAMAAAWGATLRITDWAPTRLQAGVRQDDGDG